MQLPSSAGAASGEGQPVVGRQVAGGGEIDLSSFTQTPDLMQSLATLSELGPMIQKAIAEGNVTVTQGPSQTIDMRGSELGDEIRNIMRQHGIDPEAQTGQSIEAADFSGMQQQILEALGRHGIDPNASGTSLDLRVEKGDQA